MSHSALAIAGFYDHEQHTQRRAPDWGGDDLFTTAAPRRRAAHPRGWDAPRERGAHAGPAEPHAHGAAARTDAEARREVMARLEAEARLDATAHERALDRYVEPVPTGRRTVTITGRPQEAYLNRRPARTIDERIAHRPERIASWTCAMGFLLILLAVLTAH